jgi:hypothetical protein
MNVSVTVDDRIVAQNLGEMSERLKTQLQVLGQATGQKIQEYAQANAPWTDRTGDARQRLKYNSEINDNGLTISIFHQMEYGIYLELCNNEKYAILKNSRDAMLPEFLDAVKHIRL